MWTLPRWSNWRIPPTRARASPRNRGFNVEMLGHFPYVSGWKSCEMQRLMQITCWGIPNLQMNLMIHERSTWWDDNVFHLYFYQSWNWVVAMKPYMIVEFPATEIWGISCLLILGQTLSSWSWRCFLAKKKHGTRVSTHTLVRGSRSRDPVGLFITALSSIS